MSKREQYQGQPAEGLKPLREWGHTETFSGEELEAWKRSPVTRLESRVIVTIADLQAQVEELKEIGQEHYNNRIAELETERDEARRKVDWMEGASLESVVTWNMASQRTLNMMCEAYQAGKQEVREANRQLAAVVEAVKAQDARLVKYASGQDWFDNLPERGQLEKVLDDLPAAAQEIGAKLAELSMLQVEVEEHRQHAQDYKERVDKLAVFEQWQNEHLTASEGRIPACLGPRCPACERAFAALREMEGT